MTTPQKLYALVIEDGSDQEVRLYRNSESVEADMLAYLHTHAEPGRLVFRIHPGVSVPGIPLLSGPLLEVSPSPQEDQQEEAYLRALTTERHRVCSCAHFMLLQAMRDVRRAPEKEPGWFLCLDDRSIAIGFCPFCGGKLPIASAEKPQS